MMKSVGMSSEYSRSRHSTRHRTGERVSADDDVIDARLAHVREHGLERRQVGVNVEEARDAHVTSVVYAMPAPWAST